jgi:hypothetical protein
MGKKIGNDIYIALGLHSNQDHLLRWSNPVQRRVRWQGSEGAAWDTAPLLSAGLHRRAERKLIVAIYQPVAYIVEL